MNVVRERPSQRLHHRVTAPFYVEIGERVHLVSDWSLGGFRINSYRDAIPEAGSQLDCTLSLPFQGFNISFEAKAELVWIDRSSRSFSARFLEMGEREKSLMSHFIDELVRGSMVPLEETIKRIDVPVTPVPTAPDPNPVDQIPIRRWPAKAIMMTTVYLLLGIVVFGYIGLAAFAALFRLEVDTAVVVSERKTLTSPARGRVAEMLITEGQSVEAGAVLALLSDRDLLRRKSDAEATLGEAKARLRELRAILTEEQARADGYQLIAENNIAQVNSVIASLTKQRLNSEHRLARTREIFAKGWTTIDKVEDVELKLAQFNSELERKQIHLRELQRLQSLGAGTRVYDGAEFVGDLAAREAAAQRAVEDVETAEKVLARIEWQHSELALIAPWPAVVRLIERPAGTDVGIGDPVVTIDRLGQSHIAAYLTQDEIALVREGDQARVYLPASGEWGEARVVGVDRTDGFIDTVRRDYQSRDAQARSAKVTLSMPRGGAASTGSPAVVYFRKRGHSLPGRLLQDLGATP